MVEPTKSRIFREFFTIVTIVITVSFGASKNLWPQDEKIAGTLFDQAVPIGNYHFLARVILTFDTPWGSIPRNVEQFEKRIWDELVLSYEAHQRQITVEDSEIEEKITETLKGNGVTFDWKDEPQLYEQWSRDTFNASVVTFENQMRHLVQVKKLYTQVFESIEPSVTEEEAYQEFLNEQNSLSVELAEFADLEAAQVFYTRVMKDTNVWDATAQEDKKKPSEDRSFRSPGFVTLEFLMDLWKFPKEAVFGMIKMEKGGFYPPQPIYEGYGVFKILDIGLADQIKYTQRKDYYFDQLRHRKKYEGFKNWMNTLRKKAVVQSYMDPPYELFQ